MTGPCQRLSHRLVRRCLNILVGSLADSVKFLGSPHTLPQLKHTTAIITRPNAQAFNQAMSQSSHDSSPERMSFANTRGNQAKAGYAQVCAHMSTSERSGTCRIPPPRAPPPPSPAAAKSRCAQPRICRLLLCPGIPPIFQELIATAPASIRLPTV
jgi:hypothetical protein